MFASQKSWTDICPVATRGRCSASQPRIQRLSSASPRSPGTSRAIPGSSGQVMTTVRRTYRTNAGPFFTRLGPTPFLVTRQQLLEQHLHDGGSWHGQNGAEHAEQLPADAERHDHTHGTEPNLPAHDLRHQDRILQLLLNDEEHRDAEREPG